MKYMSEFDESRPTETLYDDERHQRMSPRVHFCGSALQGPASRFFPLPESSSKNRALKRHSNKSTEPVSAKRRRFQPSSCKSSAQISRRSTRIGNCPSVAMCTDESPDGQMMDCNDNNNNNNNSSTRSKQEKRGTRAVRRCARDDSSSEDDDSDASRSRSALSRGASRSRQKTRRLKGILKRSKRRRRRGRGKKCRRRVRFSRKVTVRRVSRDGR